MLSYIGRRVLQMIPLLWVISMLSFFIIQLPPGDYLTLKMLALEQGGVGEGAKVEIARLTKEYRLDRPIYVRYFMWMGNIIRHGDFGRSFAYDKPVKEVIGEKIALTMTISILTIIFIWLVAVPIGIYSATHQYSLFDYIFTVVGFIGIATPGFLLALVVTWVSFRYFGVPITGLFSLKYMVAPWDLARVLDMLKHIWLPVILVGLGGTAGTIRVLRGCLLDELRKPYVITARAKGLSEWRLLLKYPVRLAINPFISTIGWLLPGIVSGEALVAIVLNLPTSGPVLLRALMDQDMYLAGSFILILSSLTVVGTLISDIALAWLDPRIRYEGTSKA